jgi:hypothetical protein
MRTWIVLGGVVCAVTALAQEPAAPPAPVTNFESVAALVHQFASCAALHVAAAERLERAGMSTYADIARRRAWVDQLAITYLLVEERIANGGIVREFFSLTPYAEELTAQASGRMAAIVADDDPASYGREEAACSSLTPLADEILAKISAD